MKGMSYDEFYNKLYYGADVEIEYQDKHYMINSGKSENGKYGISMFLIEENKDCKYVFEIESDDIDYNIKTFLESKVFNDKSILEALDNIKVLFS